jgi:hypothetical protein
MDSALVARIARGERLGGVAVSATAWIVLGGALYGASFGAWRAPEQALFAAIKLPALLLAVVVSATLMSAMLAMLLRAPLGVRQTAVCVLAGMATTAIVLGALAPAAFALALSVRGPDPSLLGLSLEEPRAASANAYSQAMLLGHVGVIAAAGVIGNLRLHRLLRELTGKRELALRVLLAWLAVELLAGSELSWMARPFLGRPHTPVTFAVDDPLEGSFFDEVGAAMASVLGVGGSVAVAVLAILAALALHLVSRADGLAVEVEVARELVVTSGDTRWTLPFDHVYATRVRDAVVLFADTHEVVLDVASGPARRLLVRFESSEQAELLRARVEAARDRTIGPGPFRAQAPARSQRTT